MHIEILNEAEEELFEAIHYYENISFGLGKRLKKEAQNQLQWITKNPFTARVRAKSYQRVNLKVFPYYIGY